tara:strand:- start:177 stop:1220 length:1044 start_codon:yes stop_codon:yes gene_type:complete
MKKEYDTLPPLRSPAPTGGRIGIIGCGKFSHSAIAYYLKKIGASNEIRGVMDIDIHKAASLYQSYGARYYTDDVQRLLHDPDIELIYIASNHASHAEYAAQALMLGKHVHIEKPHVVNEDQLIALCRAMQNSKGNVSLGFNRPLSPLGRMVREQLDAQDGPSMLNWFVAGHEIPGDHWYFSEKEGGRILGNLCHWTDFTFSLIPEEHRYPIKITPTRWDKSDCDIIVNYTFGDGSLATITFSAKGHTFEGVRERFSAHKGNVLLFLDDFQHLTIEEVAQKTKKQLQFRDHGHKASIEKSYQLLHGGQGYSIPYVWESAQLFLKTKEACETGRTLTIHPFSPEALNQP